MIRFAAAVLLLAVGGCSGLLRSTSPLEQVYFLRAKFPSAAEPAGAVGAAGAVGTTAAAGAGTAGAHDVANGAGMASVHVGRPVAGPGLDSSHIVLVESNRRMSYYTASRWPAALPEVVEDLASQALRASGSWSNVQSSDSPFPSDYILQIRIRRFEADYTSNAAGGAGAPETHVVLDCTLGRRSGRDVVGTFTAEGSSTAAANRLSDVVAAFEDATNMALSSLAAHAADAVHAGTQNVDNPVPSITR